MKKISLFVLLFMAWLLLVWPVEFVGGKAVVSRQDIVAGLAVALLASVVCRNVGGGFGFSWLNPLRSFWLAVYCVVLAYYVVKANLDVAYRVLHPAMPIRPGIVKVRTSLKSSTAIAALANSITLTPGTLTVHASGEGDLYANRQLIAELAVKKRLPTICPYRDYVEAGALMGYAVDLPELFRRMADDVHKILKGAKPGDIPIYQATKFELLINLKTAKAFALTVPPALLARADEVIE